MATIPRNDPPKNRPVDGGPDIRLEGRQPDRAYMLANPSDQYCGLQKALADGWEIETARKDGPRFAGLKTKEGEALMYREQVLVSRPLADHEADMERAQSYADLAERRSLEAGGADKVLGGTGKLAVNRSVIDRVQTV